MVGTQVKATATTAGSGGSVARRDAASPSSPLHPSSSPLRSPGAEPRLTMQSAKPSATAWGRAEEMRRKRLRDAARTRSRAGMSGEVAAIMGIVAVFAAACALGVVYLSAYAGVDARGRAIHTLQGELSAAQAQHEILVQRYTQLSSASRIQALAKREHMVLNNHAQYITLTPTGAGAASVRQVASAQ